MTNTQRTLKHLRDKGWKCGIVERFVKCAGRKDLFGIIDIVAIYADRTLGVQSCGKDFALHYNKIIENENSLDWINAGNELLLMSWRKVKKERGKKRMVFKERIHFFSKEELECKQHI